MRRSLYISADIRQGEPFTAANLRSVRPGHGLPPKHIDGVLGRLATRDISFGEPLDWSMVEGGGPA
jgi:N-acetylneuraminate synthase